VKVLDFYRQQASVDDALRESNDNTIESAGLTPLKTANIERLSGSVRNLKRLDGSLVQRWIKYWLDAGF
jgi:hypothetical protein